MRVITKLRLFLVLMFVLMMSFSAKIPVLAYYTSIGYYSDPGVYWAHQNAEITKKVKKYCIDNKKFDYDRCKKACDIKKSYRKNLKLDDYCKEAKKISEKKKLQKKDSTKIVQPKTVQISLKKYDQKKEQSEVASLIQREISVNLKNKIGGEIRLIQKKGQLYFVQQNKIISKMEEVNSIKKFLIGANRENIAQLKKELTNNELVLKELDGLLSQVESKEFEPDIQKEASIIKLQQEKISKVVNENENSFNLFGWITKIF